MSGPVKKILLVDDEEDIRIMMKDLIEEHFDGVQVIAANNGQDANWKLGNEQFEILLTDIRMPKISGVELIANLKKIRNVKLPDHIIIFSGAVTPAIAKLLSKRTLKTFAKPLDPQKFLEYLEGLGLKRRV